MQLSLHADYSFRVLIYLGSIPEGSRANIKQIADAYGISENHLIKVVHHLAKLEVIETTRGRSGGLTLKKAPEDIRLGALFRASEPNLDLLECFDVKTNTCPILGACTFKGIVSEALAEFNRVLDRYTLKDLLVNRGKLCATLNIPT